MEKIVVFTPSLNIGGIERILLTYAKGLAEKGYDVTYLTLSNKGDFELAYCKNLTFESLGVERLRQALFDLIRFFKLSKPDIIFVANEATFIVYIAKILSGITAKVITSQHNYYDIFDKVGFVETFVPRYIFPLCFKVIAVSEGIRNMLLNSKHLKADKVVKIYNPIDISEIENRSLDFVADLPEEYILFVGRFDKVKNLPLLLNAYKLFQKRFPHVKLLIIGGGSEAASMEDFIDECLLRDQVQLLGVKSNPFPYIRAAKIIALSSISEAFPTILLESLVLGRTIVSTPTLGAIDILENNKYGYISDSIYGVEDFHTQLVNAYLNPLNPFVLNEYSSSNYKLEIKVREFESLWKGVE